MGQWKLEGGRIVLYDRVKKTLSDKITIREDIAKFEFNYHGFWIKEVDVKQSLKEFIDWFYFSNKPSYDEFKSKAKEIFGERLL